MELDSYEPTRSINFRRTVFKYENKPVPQAILEQGFEAARQAPCHKHTNPWRFYVLGQTAREKLLPLATQLAQKRAAGQAPEQIEKVWRGPFPN